MGGYGGGAKMSSGGGYGGGMSSGMSMGGYGGGKSSGGGYGSEGGQVIQAAIHSKHQIEYRDVPSSGQVQPTTIEVG